MDLHFPAFAAIKETPGLDSLALVQQVSAEAIVVDTIAETAQVNQTVDFTGTVNQTIQVEAEIES